MSARAAVAAGVVGYVVGRFVGQARAWLDVLADLPDLPTDDDPVLDLPWQRSAPRVELELTRTVTDAELAGFCTRWNAARPEDPLDYDTLRYLA